MEFRNLVRYRRDGVIPGSRGEFGFATSTSSSHRALQAVGIVERLYGSLSTRAEPASTYWIERIAFDLLHACDSLPKLLAMAFNRTLAFHNSHDCAAASTAFSADGSMPLLLIRDDVVIRDKQWNERVSFPSAGARGYSRRNRGYDFEKIAAVHTSQISPLR